MCKKQKFYAVAKGFQTGIFLDHSAWFEATQGFKGNQFKICNTLEEAENYLAVRKIETKISESLDPKIIKPAVTHSPKGTILPQETTVWERLAKGDTVIFSDGSVSSDRQQYGCGVVIISPDGGTQKLTFSGEDRRFLDSGATAGELIAAIHALNFLMIMGVKNVSIFHDAESVATVPKATSKPRKELTRFYKKTMREKILPNMEVSFIHVTSHTGHRFNEMADRLAKQLLS